MRCENCSNDFLVGKTIFRDDRHHFCSTKCRQQWYAEVWSQSEEWREKSRIRSVMLLNSKPAKTQTKPQIAVNNMLESLGIRYRNEENFVYYSIDNYLPDGDLAIEVMGDYWHASPIKYPSELNDRQRHVVSRDKAKHTYIKNKYGFEILYLWESDINKQPELCERLIVEYINNSGKLDNFHSFNYRYDNNKLYLNTEIIIPHQQN